MHDQLSLPGALSYLKSSMVHIFEPQNLLHIIVMNLAAVGTYKCLQAIDLGRRSQKEKKM